MAINRFLPDSFPSYFGGLLSVILLLTIFIVDPAVAQTPAENKVRFDNAKVLVDRGQHELAMRELLPLTQNLSAGTQTAFAPEAAYLYALAAYRAGKLNEAEQMLTRLKTSQPNWQGMQEAIYLQANIAFDKGNYELGLQLLNSGNFTSVKADSERLRAHHLKQIRNRETLASLAQKFPKDREVGAAYAGLVRSTYTPADKQLLEQLISTYQLDRSKFKPVNISVTKPAYRVAVLFPFGLEPGSSRKNQFVIDLYEGIRYAADSLNKMGGSRLDLFTYETSADTNNLRRILALPELQTMDLLIGPVYKSGSRMVSRFANQYRIPVINPLSEDAELMQASNFLYLFESSLHTKARELALFTFSNFEPKDGVVIYETKRDDSTLAALYKLEFEKLGGTISTFKKVHSVNKAYNTAFISGLEVAETGHLAVFSETPNVAVNFMSMLDSKDVWQAVLAPAAWLEMQQMPLDQLDARDVYFIGPHLIDPKTPGLSRFQKGYRTRTHLPPSVYATSGFELMWQFGQALQQFGTQFGPALSASGYRQGVLYPGVDYSRSNDNSYVPLLKLENRELMRANAAGSPTNLLPPPPPPPPPADDKQTQPIKK